MNGQGVGQLLLFFVGALVVLAYPLGWWLARVYGSFRRPRPLQVLVLTLTAVTVVTRRASRRSSTRELTE